MTWQILALCRDLVYPLFFFSQIKATSFVILAGKECWKRHSLNLDQTELAKSREAFTNLWVMLGTVGRQCLPTHPNLATCSQKSTAFAKFTNELQTGRITKCSYFCILSHVSICPSGSLHRLRFTHAGPGWPVGFHTPFNFTLAIQTLSLYFFLRSL